MAALREILVAFGVEFDTKPIDDGEKKIGNLLGSVKELGAALVGAFAVKEISAWVLDMVSLGDAVGDQAARLNLSSKALEEWTYQAKFADIAAGDLNGIFDKVARSAVEAGDATSEQGKILKKLGVDVKDGAGGFKDTGTLFEEVGLALAGMSDQTERTALSFQFFGKTAGPKVLQLFKEGPAGIAKMRAEFEELGGGMGSFVEEAGEVDDNLHRLDLAWTSAKVKIAAFFLPALNMAVRGLTKVSSGISKIVAHSSVAQAALATLAGFLVAKGIAISVAWAPVIGTFLLWAAGVAAVVVMLDDLITFFRGGDSVIGRAIDKLFGPGSSDKVRAWGAAIAEAFKGFTSKTFEVAVGTFKSALALIGMVFAKNTEESAKFESAFLKHSAVVVNAIDSIIAKLQFLKDLIPTSFGDALDTFVTGANDALDLAEVGLNKLGLVDLDRQNRKLAGPAGGGGAGPAPAPITSAAIRDAYLPPGAKQASGFFAGAGGGSAPIVVNNAPVTNVNVAPGTPASQQRAVASVAETGAMKGANRAAKAALERKGK
jgi:hypothetical protein